MTRRRASLALALLPLLAACALTPPVPPAAPAAKPTRWRGRFSASYPEPRSEGGRGRASGRFSLEQSNEGDVLLELANPIGQLIARARSGRDGAELIDARGALHRAIDDESLTETLFGWRIPVRALPLWLSAAGTAGATGPMAVDSPWSVRTVPSETGRAPILELSFPASEPDPARRLHLRLIIDSAG